MAEASRGVEAVYRAGRCHGVAGDGRKQFCIIVQASNKGKAIVAAALRRVCELLGKERLGAVRLDSADCPALIGRLQLSARFCRSV